MVCKLEYLWLSLNISWAFIFCIDKHLCMVSKVFGINKEKEIGLPKK